MNGVGFPFCLIHGVHKLIVAVWFIQRFVSASEKNTPNIPVRGSRMCPPQAGGPTECWGVLRGAVWGHRSPGRSRGPLQERSSEGRAYSSGREGAPRVRLPSQGRGRGARSSAAGAAWAVGFDRRSWAERPVCRVPGSSSQPRGPRRGLQEHASRSFSPTVPFRKPRSSYFF